MCSSTTTTCSIADSIVLPISKRTISNRMLKAAFTEGLADPNTCQPNERHFELYKKWAEGGAAMILTGNLMVDREHRESPRNVALDETSDLEAFRQWAKVIQDNGSSYMTTKPLALMQLSHPGRQSPVSCTGYTEVVPVSASNHQKARLVLPGWLGVICAYLFMRNNRALELSEMPVIAQQFATAARLAEEAGWDGVEIHGAHGYLLSQFLSPTANYRTDDYGGDAKGRRRLLLEVIAAIRKATSPSFVVGVKINSKDRGKEGNEREKECLELIQALIEQEQCDYLEISGGSYEDAFFMFTPDKDMAATGLFTSFAERLKREVQFTEKSPKIVLTGGFRTKEGMEQALNQNLCDMIGLGRPLISNPNFCNELLAAAAKEKEDGQQQDVKSTCFTLHVPIFKALLESALNNLWNQQQLHRIADGLAPDPSLGYLYALTVGFVYSYIFDKDFRGHAAYRRSRKQSSATNDRRKDKKDKKE